MTTRLCLTALLLCASASAEPNVAKPDKHPYVDPAGGRETHQPIASHKVNEARVYDFYQRQADYYMAMSPGEIPEILPAFPGLDAGLHGHWGKHNQNNHEDGRWNDMDHGPLVTQVFRVGKLSVLKGMSIRLGDKLSAVFDPQHLCYRGVWEGSFVKFHPFRWGSSRNAAPDGEVWFAEKPRNAWTGDRQGIYHGHYRYGDEVILSYSIEGSHILERPGSLEEDGLWFFSRELYFPNGSDGFEIVANVRRDGWGFSHEPSFNKSTIAVNEGYCRYRIEPKAAGEHQGLRRVATR